MSRKPARIIVDKRGQDTLVSGAARNARGVHYLFRGIRVKREGLSVKEQRALVGEAIAELMAQPIDK